MTSTALHANSLPKQARDAVVRNVIGGGGNWVLINIDSSPPLVIPSTDLTRLQWLDVIVALRDQAEYHFTDKEPEL
jgi:hypothetical protein